MTSAGPNEVTALLEKWSNGNRDALDDLIPIVYAELRQLARDCLRRERPDHTLQPTALTHEAFMRLIGQREVRWQNRAHFFAIAAQMMRRILVEHARKCRAVKRGGNWTRVSLDEAAGSTEPFDVDLLALDVALSRLADIDARQNQIVELRYFGGLSIEQTAEVVGVSPATVKRDWTVAKLWLRREIQRA